MNLNVILHGVVHLVTKRYLGPFWYRRAWLKKTERLSAGELEQIQLQYLKKILVHSHKTTPFYRERMRQCNFNPDIKTIEDIQKLPILTKQEILEAGEAIVSSAYPRRINAVGLTGGTTGTPLRIQRDLFSLGTEHAFVRRQWDWAGLSFKDRTVFLSGRPVVPPDQVAGRLYAYDPFMKELILSNYHLSPQHVKQFVDAIIRYKITAIAGYTSSIFYFAQLCEEQGYPIRLKAALTTSETMNDHMRSTIERIFQCKVFDFYGAAERVCYIFTCEQGNYHILPEYGLTELVPQSGPLEGAYKIVATGFWNRAMPLIRYDTGDCLELSNEVCMCGRHFQTVKRINGRTGTYIQTPSGKKYAPTLMARVSKMTHNVLQTQIIQDRLDHILVIFIPSAKFSQEDLLELKGNMRSFMPSELGIDYQEVQSMIKTESGKTNLIVSRI